MTDEQVESFRRDGYLIIGEGFLSAGSIEDASFAGYLVPSEMITCWVALDDTQAGGGTIEHVKGSHLWPKTAAPPTTTVGPSTARVPTRPPSSDALRPQAFRDQQGHAQRAARL